MGLFQQRPEEEQKAWAGLPAEPLEQTEAEHLDEVPSSDALFGLGTGPQYTTMVFPVAPPAPEADDPARSEGD